MSTRVNIYMTVHSEKRDSHKGTLSLTVQPEIESINVDKVLPKLKKDIVDVAMGYGFKINEESW